MKKKVTFTLPAEGVADATGGLLLGDFNNWNVSNGYEMKKQKDGSLKATIELEAGKSYQYRYLLNNGKWENDYHAQGYVQACGYDVDNCLITVVEDVPAPVRIAKIEKPVSAKKSNEAKAKAGKVVRVKEAKVVAAKAKPGKAKVSEPKKGKSKAVKNSGHTSEIARP